MHTIIRIRRHALVLVLILATGLAAAGLRLQDPAVPALPAIGTMTQGSHWHVEVAYEPGGWGMVYRQWLLRDQSGHEALLYVGATARVQTMLRWTGELGYLGDGYVVADRGTSSVGVGGGRSVPVAQAVVQHLSDRRLLQYALVGPGGSVARQGSDLLAGAAWEAIRGHSAGYYLVRVSIPAPAGIQPASGTAGDVLSTVLPPVLARARTAS
jgi:hypothetical protein